MSETPYVDSGTKNIVQLSTSSKYQSQTSLLMTESMVTENVQVAKIVNNSSLLEHLVLLEKPYSHLGVLPGSLYQQGVLGASINISLPQCHCLWCDVQLPHVFCFPPQQTDLCVSVWKNFLEK